MNGIMFAQFLESSVKQLNDPTNNCMIAVPSEYEAVIRFIADKSIHRARRLYEVMMKRKLPPLPIAWEKFADIHAEAFEEALGSLMAMLVGSARKINEFEIEFCKGVKKIESNYRKKNEKALCEFHENLAKRFWNSFVNVGLQEGNFFVSISGFTSKHLWIYSDLCNFFFSSSGPKQTLTKQLKSLNTNMSWR